MVYVLFSFIVHLNQFCIKPLSMLWWPKLR